MSKFDRAGAHRRAQQVRDGVTAITDLIDTLVEIQERQDWLALGYKSWTEYYEGEFGPTRLKLSAEQRAQVVGVLAASGMSKRQVAKALGVSDMTVRRDLAGATNVAPDAAKQQAKAKDDITLALTGVIEDVAAHTSGAVPPASTEDASPVLGEPDVDEQAASTSGTPDSPAADSLPPQAHAGVPAVGGQIEERDEERAGYPETFDDLGCPVCSFTIEVSEEDPDASLSEMYNHIWRQCAMGEGEERRRSAHDLLARVRQISPAADPLAPPSPQQPGHNSPTGIEGSRSEAISPTGQEAVQPHEGRSETDFPAGPDQPVATTVLPGIDHHDGSGVSRPGEALPVESAGALLEDGDAAVTPSSSDPDALMTAFAALVHYLSQLDADALGPLLHEDDMPTLFDHIETFEVFVRRLGKARFTEMVRTP